MKIKRMRRRMKKYGCHMSGKTAEACDVISYFKEGKVQLWVSYSLEQMLFSHLHTDNLSSTVGRCSTMIPSSQCPCVSWQRGAVHGDGRCDGERGMEGGWI